MQQISDGPGKIFWAITLKDFEWNIHNLLSAGLSTSLTYEINNIINKNK